MSQEDSIAAEVQQIDAAEVYRSIGRLEREVAHLIGGWIGSSHGWTV